MSSGGASSYIIIVVATFSAIYVFFGIAVCGMAMVTGNAWLVVGSVVAYVGNLWMLSVVNRQW